MAETIRYKQIEGARRRGGCLYLVAAVIILLIAARSIASLVIDYQWWQEMGHLQTWYSLWLYSVLPTVAATLIAFAVLWIAHARALKFARTRLGERPLYAKLSALVLLILSVLLMLGTIDSWTVVRYFGGRSLALNVAEWHDPVFGQPLTFYLFQLPFYSLLLRVVIVTGVAAALVYWLSARGWQLRSRFADLTQLQHFDLRDLGLEGALESRFVRALGAALLIALALRFYLTRYGMLLNDHGFMVGIDYVNQNIGLPLQWVLIASCVLGAAAFLIRRPAWALIVVAALVVRAAVPIAVGALYVRPNEISLERPFIDRHIQATRSAYGIDSRTREIEFQAKSEAPIDVARHKLLLDNVRLWDWKAFRDTLSQIQPLRPYVYTNVDADRYTMEGKLRQVLLAPRELDLNGLGEARSRWINPHFIYTHGYGIVMAEANEITANGLPVLFVKDAPPEITVPDLKLTRPELYFSEIEHDPVFVRTAQPEFNYPAGQHNVQTRYEGKGGFPISSFPLRTAAAVSHGDWNILLTSYLTPESRMMIHRRITERVNTLAGFLLWDPDPYLMLGKDGRLVWIIDGYMTSSVHPYSRDIEFEGMAPLNYIRNSVKATVDAYDGTVNFYIFDPQDPLIRAYNNLFPGLFQPASAMPADIRAHVRYPELIFRAQMEIYRTFHMRDPETFYNKSDAWDVPKFTSGQGTTPEPIAPNYLVATLPGETNPEFLLMIPFSPRNRENLIGLMMARCDGEHLGEKVVLLLSKQEIVLGPMQVEARINQDQTISKDLTLWNQQGSQVLRGQMLVLPIDNTFLYVEPIYLQASQARMPQLKKVALAVGNTLIYTDTYQQALAQLAGMPAGPPPAPAQGQPATASAPAPASAPAGQRIIEIRQHLQRYRDLTALGKWSEAGKELEAVQALVK
ncbi:MAG: UPF0182 family protein [Bryobacteraceae bacterium]